MISETMVWKEKGRSRIRAGQIDSLRSFLGIRRMDHVTKCADKGVVRSGEMGRRED